MTAGGAIYVNKESFEELLCWLQIPGLLAVAGEGADGGPSGHARLAAIEAGVSSECRAMKDAGFELRNYLKGEAEVKPATKEGEILPHGRQCAGCRCFGITRQDRALMDSRGQTAWVPSRTASENAAAEA